jgi:hypothetical protein
MIDTDPDWYARYRSEVEAFQDRKPMFRQMIETSWAVAWLVEKGPINHKEREVLSEILARLRETELYMRMQGATQ